MNNSKKNAYSNPNLGIYRLLESWNSKIKILAAISTLMVCMVGYRGCDDPSARSSALMIFYLAVDGDGVCNGSLGT